MWVREMGTLVSREAYRCPGGDVVTRPQRFSMEGISSILHSGLRQTFGPATNEKQVLPFSPQIAQICPLSPALLHTLFPCIPQTQFSPFKILFNLTVLQHTFPFFANPPCKIIFFHPQNPPFMFGQFLQHPNNSISPKCLQIKCDCRKVADILCICAFMLIWYNLHHRDEQKYIVL